MTKKRIETKARYLEMYVSNNCWVGRTLPDFNTPVREWHILPATEYGLVAVIEGRYPPLLTKPLVGYLVYRPKLLELAIPDIARVEVLSLRLDDMQGWCKDTLPWEIVGRKRDSAWQHATTR
jgi:hypothetical protein